MHDRLPSKNDDVQDEALTAISPLNLAAVAGSCRSKQEAVLFSEPTDIENLVR